jgi:hypothetical protein
MAVSAMVFVGAYFAPEWLARSTSAQALVELTEWAVTPAIGAVAVIQDGVGATPGVVIPAIGAADPIGWATQVGVIQDGIQATIGMIVIGHRSPLRRLLHRSSSLRRRNLMQTRHWAAFAQRPYAHANFIPPRRSEPGAHAGLRVGEPVAT